MSEFDNVKADVKSDLLKAQEAARKLRAEEGMLAEDFQAQQQKAESWVMRHPLLVVYGVLLGALALILLTAHAFLAH